MSACISTASGQAAVAQAAFVSRLCEGFLGGDTAVSIQQLLTTERNVAPLPSHPTVVVLPLSCTGSSTCLICWFSSFDEQKKNISFLGGWVWGFLLVFVCFVWFVFFFSRFSELS